MKNLIVVSFWGQCLGPLFSKQLMILLSVRDRKLLNSEKETYNLPVESLVIIPVAELSGARETLSAQLCCFCLQYENKHQLFSRLPREGSSLCPRRLSPTDNGGKTLTWHLHVSETALNI